MKKNKKKIKFFPNKKIVDYILVPLALVFFWMTCSVLLDKQKSFSVLQYPNDSAPRNSTKLLKGEKITGEFSAKENYLGIVTLRFDRYITPDYRGEDVLLFRVREKGAKNWYHYNAYRSGLLKNQLLFPFGFPVIPDSKGKTYDFEIESTYGNINNAVELSTQEPVLFTSYQYPKIEIAGSKRRLISFLYKKTTTSFTNSDFVLSSLIFALPLFFYILWLLIIRKYKKANRLSALFLVYSVPVLIIIDIFLLKPVYIGLLLGLLAIWLLSTKLNKLGPNISFSIAFILIILWGVLTFFGIHTFSNKLNVWTYAFLVIGLIQLILGERKNEKI